MSHTVTEEIFATYEYDDSPVRHVSALELPLSNTLRRTTSHQQDESVEEVPEDFLPLRKSASAISGHREEYLRSHHEHGNQAESSRSSGHTAPAALNLARPGPLKLGPVDIIHEVPSAFATPASEKVPRFVSTSLPSTRPASPVVSSSHSPTTPRQELDVEDHTAVGYPDVGRLASWRGFMILLVTCGAQLLDNVFMTGVNISLPAIQEDFDVDGGQLQWLISAYTLTFGGFLLLAGVMSDRYGRKNIFCAGMAWLSIWTIANGFATSFIQIAIFRALQGIGAAMTVPSGVGIISAFFVSQDRTKALTYFGAAGAVGFCLGLILGGFITSSLGWRYLFYLTCIVTGVLAAVGMFTLPRDRHMEEGHVRPRLDFLGAGLSTGGLILLSFVLSSGGEYGWSKAFIIALLVISVALLVVFTWVEKKVKDPIMPLSLWKVPNFAAIWISGFLIYGAYQTELYYLVLISQDVLGLSAGATAIRLLPMGFVGGSIAISMGSVLDKVNTKYLLLAGLVCCTIAPIPTAIMDPQNLSFWTHIFPTSILGVVGIAIGYCTITVVLLASVPVSAKSLCGGMVNTAYQLGSGVGLALATAVVQATETGKGKGLLEQYTMGMWVCVGLAGIALVSCVVGVRSVKRDTGAIHAGAIH